MTRRAKELTVLVGAVLFVLVVAMMVYSCAADGDQPAEETTSIEGTTKQAKAPEESREGKEDTQVVVQKDNDLPPTGGE